jgi:hypothetical protein
MALWERSASGWQVSGAVDPVLTTACYAVYRLTKLKQAFRSAQDTIERRTVALPAMPDAARAALKGYMENASEQLYAAGWVGGLADSLRDDPAYKLLTQIAGGTFNDDEQFVED